MRIIMFDTRIPSRSGDETVLTELCPKLVLNGLKSRLLIVLGEKLSMGIINLYVLRS